MTDERFRDALRRYGLWWRLLAFAALLLLGAAGLWLALRSDEGVDIGVADIVRGEVRRLEPMQPAGAPLRTAQGGVDRVYVLGSQSETIVPLRLFPDHGPRAPRQYLHVDLWAIDAATARLAWRKRLRTYEGNARRNMDLRAFDLLGADGGTLWLSVREPLAVSLSDGRVLADGARIDALNARLAGKRVDRPGYMAFGRNGLQLTLDDATQWNIDSADFSARPREVPARDPARIVGPAQARTSTQQFQVRGLPMEGRWLGVLTDAEADVLRNPPVVPGRDPGERRGAMYDFLASQHVPQRLEPHPQAYRLWSARVAQVSAAPRDWAKELPDHWGTRPAFSDYAPLPEAPAFLQAGLLGDGIGDVPLWYRGPDSVLVLHYDRIGGAGHLQLARIAGPAGRSVWQAALPLDALNAVMRKDGASLLLSGSEEVENATAARDEAPVTTQRRIVSVVTASGRVLAFDLTAESLRQDVQPVVAGDD
jgi:hypothetical protein